MLNRDCLFYLLHYLNYYLFWIYNNLNVIGKYESFSNSGISITFYNNAKADCSIEWLSATKGKGAFMMHLGGIFNYVNFSANTPYKIFTINGPRDNFMINGATFLLSQTNAWTDTTFHIYNSSTMAKSKDFYVRPTTACRNISGCLVLFGYLY